METAAHGRVQPRVISFTLWASAVSIALSA
jgi:hypothetical protein